MHTTYLSATALGIAPKELDNFIARACRDFVPSGQRGRARALDEATLELLAVALLLRRDLRTSPARAVALARELVHDPHTTKLGVLGTLSFDIPRLRQVLKGAISDAVETDPRRPRGRPRGKKQRGAPT